MVVVVSLTESVKNCESEIIVKYCSWANCTEFCPKLFGLFWKYFKDKISKIIMIKDHDIELLARKMCATG